MYIKTNPSQCGYRNGGQTAGGKYLIVFCDPTETFIDPTPEKGGRKLDCLLAVVKNVRLKQLGHFMMGSADVGRHHFGLSGELGSDGLPLDFRPMVQAKEGFRRGEWVHVDMTPEDIAELKEKYLRKVPNEVATAYWNSEGHNCVGSNGKTALIKWAKEEFKI